jgi:hypothetical protein
MDDAIAIALKGQTKGVFFLWILSSPRMGTLHSIGCEQFMLTPLQILTPEHTFDPHDTSTAPATALFAAPEGGRAPSDYGMRREDTPAAYCRDAT